MSKADFAWSNTLLMKSLLGGMRFPVHIFRGVNSCSRCLELIRDSIAFRRIIADYYLDLTEADIRPCVQYAMDLLAGQDLEPRMKHG
jgi:hypothetical protein